MNKPELHRTSLNYIEHSSYFYSTKVTGSRVTPPYLKPKPYELLRDFVLSVTVLTRMSVLDDSSRLFVVFQGLFERGGQPLQRFTTAVVQSNLYDVEC